MPRRNYRKKKLTIGRKTKFTVDKYQNKAIKTLKKKVKALEIPREKKYQYTYIGIDNIDQTPQATTMNLIRPWDSSVPNANVNKLNAREGDTVCMKKLMVNALLFIPYELLSPTRDTSTRVRMIYVYYPDEPPGTLITDILETGLIASGMSYIDCTYKRNGRLKYKILKDVTYNLEANNYNFTNTPATPVTNSFAGISSTKPSQVSIRHKFDLTKLPNLGKVVWKDSLPVPTLGMIAQFIVSDNQDLSVYMTGQSQLTWEDN